MAWQSEVGSGTDRAAGYRDLLTKLVAFATSQRVSAVSVNAAGSGYVVGDVLTLTHAGAYLDARFEVTSVGGSGDVTGLRIVSSGAFANRVATVAVNAGGSGYAANDVVEIQGGTAREAAKAKVTTVSAGAVTAIALFETGGAYSSAPTLTGAATDSSIGTGSGTGLTVDLTMTSLVSTTGQAVTGGTGSSCTVDITLAETGWTAVRNANKLTLNSITDEKEVVLKGDASGSTNKPYVGFRTGTATVGINTRYFVQVLGMVAHNPATALHLQPAISPGISTSDGSLVANGSYILCPENSSTGAMDFWFSVDDVRLCGAVNENPTATTSNGRYFQFYAGYIDRLQTETEDPYPMFVGASARDYSLQPSAANDGITSIAECRTPGTGPWVFYAATTGSWVTVQNSNAISAPNDEPNVMFPFGELNKDTSSSSAQKVVDDGLQLNDSVIKRDRSAATAVLWPVPGSTRKPFLFPLVIGRKVAATFAEATDWPRGTIRGMHWLFNSDSTGAAIMDFSEDYITIGSDRYRVFHNHVHSSERYQYIAIKEDV